MENERENDKKVGKNRHAAKKYKKNKLDTVNLMDSATINDKNNGKHSKTPKKMKAWKQVLLAIVAILLVTVIVACLTFPHAIIGGLKYLFGANKDNTFDDTKVGVNSATEEKFKDKYINIALFGLDNRKDKMSGRSDAVMIITVDIVNKKIKMSSIARDTYVDIPGRGGDKLTHAYAYGRAQLAVETINRNFKMNITDYVTVNFFQMAKLIDYVGGVVIDVNEGEMNIMNTKYIPYIKEMGIKCDYVKKPGKQLLTGGQALAYSRDRYTGGNDIQRGNRQKEVIMAAYDKIMSSDTITLTNAVGMLLGNCETSLSFDELLDLGKWAMSSDLRGLVGYSIPEESDYGTETIDGVSYVVYDLDIASQKLHKFIESK